MRILPCGPRFISPMKSGGYHGPACQVIRLSWPDISSAKQLCARSGETGLAAVLSKQRLTHPAIVVGMLFVDERPETNAYSWTGDLLMCTSSTGHRTCSTCRLKSRGLAQEYCCAPLSLLKESIG